MSSSILIESDLCSTSKDFPKSIDWAQLCNKLERLTGVEPKDMQVIFKYRDNDHEKALIPPEYMSNGVPYFEQVERIVVKDLNVNSMANSLKGDMNNKDETKLFKLSEEDYERKSDSVLQWKKQNKLGRFDPKYQDKILKDRDLQLQNAKQLEVNERCLVIPSEDGGMERRGWLRFLGKVPEINNDDMWCGIEFDEPLGKNDGSIKGKRYFGPVRSNHGGFIKPSQVKTGSQYIPIDEFASSDDEI